MMPQMVLGKLNRNPSGRDGIYGPLKCPTLGLQLSGLMSLTNPVLSSVQEEKALSSKLYRQSPKYPLLALPHTPLTVFLVTCYLKAATINNLWDCFKTSTGGHSGN